MVEYTLGITQSPIDAIFYSLSDSTRRDILQRVATHELSVSEIAHNYDLSFAAISKHLKVLEKAKLILKRREGTKQMVTLAPYALKSADDYLEQYRQKWQGSFNKLETLLKEEE